MADIYDRLIRSDYRELDTDTLKDLHNESEDAFRGILSGMTAMGSMAFWLQGAENYSDEIASADLRALGNALMYLPRIAEALNDNAQNAQFEIWRREGLPK
ncbi:hypothetical protein [Yersinia similis]|uniref:Ubiquinol-cytochrome C reductase n=1 Tax=Yersinia similis TaxID=367190 RepID=A0A0T9RBW6_9GAMM|nr:hypothetical protein [Yersinia similis]AHK18658.1 hypothetical protein BF17_04345 [Yersinia similis]CFQ73036.1 Uncharacterised protein [Yersinia similis]CNB83387.1 Uncharacterised protein [Yersinia similis]CNF35349.1 Uncharacterised protein [Yersinia similis]CNG37559.1 Uncharacterised protein [Yersinia similis]